MEYEEAVKTFELNDETGVLTWKLRDRSEFKSEIAYSGHKRFVGKVAGSKVTHGTNIYLQINSQGRKLFAHRIVWLLLNGYHAKNVDHIDGNGCNNKPSNIRDVTSKANSMNIRKGSKNTSGHIGVYANKKSQKKPWRVFIKVDGKMISRGVFETIDEAIVERAIAEREYGFSLRHGC